jgi:hypothetical protein
MYGLGFKPKTIPCLMSLVKFCQKHILYCPFEKRNTSVTLELNLKEVKRHTHQSKIGSQLWIRCNIWILDAVFWPHWGVYTRECLLWYAFVMPSNWAPPTFDKRHALNSLVLFQSTFVTSVKWTSERCQTALNAESQCFPLQFLFVKKLRNALRVVQTPALLSSTHKNLLEPETWNQQQQLSYPRELAIRTHLSDSLRPFHL